MMVCPNCSTESKYRCHNTQMKEQSYRVRWYICYECGCKFKTVEQIVSVKGPDEKKYRKFDAKVEVTC